MAVLPGAEFALRSMMESEDVDVFTVTLLGSSWYGAAIGCPVCREVILDPPLLPDAARRYDIATKKQTRSSR